MSQPLLNRLVFAGEAIVDLLMWVPALPERGGDMLAGSAAIEVGGGFNIMAAAVRPRGARAWFTMWRIHSRGDRFRHFISGRNRSRRGS